MQTLEKTQQSDSSSQDNLQDKKYEELKIKHSRVENEVEDAKKARDRFRNQTLDQKVEIKRLKKVISENAYTEEVNDEL